MAIPTLPSKRAIGKLSFASTLYLCPVIDVLLADIPEEFHAELRLGLQEALVNAAKHGNQLDPSKTVVVEFATNQEGYWWTISDEGTVPLTPCCCRPRLEGYLPEDTSECGRGLFILQQVFDSVEWYPEKRQIRLGKKFADSV
ncbi:MAG: anti-sigma regulatory factor [Coleofasciculaceae cyanobacterium RL_1_1]|nr:anti-sigma regulatory factor [Coleofasciculaceae cyanobacterium RL_1_1]